MAKIEMVCCDICLNPVRHKSGGVKSNFKDFRVILSDDGECKLENAEIAGEHLCIDCFMGELEFFFADKLAERYRAKWHK